MKKKILFAASEAVPFIKTGGLADVVGSLPRYFPTRLYDVRIIIPLYACMDQKFLGNMELILESQVRLNWRTQYVGVFRAKVDGITYYLIDNKYYFNGPTPYDNIVMDAEKFAYFSKAVLTVLPKIGFRPAIIHCHDWQTGLIPVFLYQDFWKDKFYRSMKTVMTIHNLRFQGRWYIDAIRDITGLPDEYFTFDRLESYGRANLLKGGIMFANEITTVSESYAREIQTPDGGEGLDRALAARRDHLTGICNGIDYKIFNPKKDPALVRQLASSIPCYKQENKKALQKEAGLNQDPHAFLIGMVTRLTDQKGLDLFAYRKEYLMENPCIQFVLLGSGEPQYENMLRSFAASYPGRVFVSIDYDEAFAHRIYAGSDAFLMPSMFEPCGLSQLMSLRYGSVPMVRETGGLKDTVEPYNEYAHTGTGFSFSNYNAHEMSHMIEYAMHVYYDMPKEWAGIVERGMKKDFSWKRSVESYENLYERMTAAPVARKIG